MNEINVGIGAYHVGSNPAAFTSTGLGSCVGIAIYDRIRKLGGLAHALLPKYSQGKCNDNPNKYADTLTFLMIDELVEMGASRSLLEAKLVGGAQMFSFVGTDTLDIGRRNFEAAKEALKREKIPLIAKDIGGKTSRMVRFDLKTTDVTVRKGNKVIVL